MTPAEALKTIRQAQSARPTGEGPPNVQAKDAWDAFLPFARRALRDLKDGSLGDEHDLVGDFMVRQMKTNFRLLNVPPETVAAATQKLFYDLAAKQNPRWPMVKALRAHVKSALANLDESAVERGMPRSIRGPDGRFSSDGVRMAVSVLVLGNRPEPKSIKVLADRLLEEYPNRLVDGAPSGVNEVENAERQNRDAEVLLPFFLEAIDLPLVQLILGADRSMDAGQLKDLAGSLGISLAAFSKRQERLVKRMHRFAAEHRMGRNSFKVFLARLALLPQWREAVEGSKAGDAPKASTPRKVAGRRR
jgi:hypothetical protein